MGRKPHPLLCEYFERGDKLADNSNRYPQTCKSCGDQFLKGRLESLFRHITKKCPYVSDDERLKLGRALYGPSYNHSPQNIFSASSGGARNWASTSARKDIGPEPPRLSPSQLAALGQMPLPPILPVTGADDFGTSNAHAGWNGLETLAEASRQVDLNERRDLELRRAALRAPFGPGAADRQSNLPFPGRASSPTEFRDEIPEERLRRLLPPPVPPRSNDATRHEIQGPPGAATTFANAPVPARPASDAQLALARAAVANARPNTVTIDLTGPESQPSVTAPPQIRRPSSPRSTTPASSRPAATGQVPARSQANNVPRRASFMITPGAHFPLPDFARGGFKMDMDTGTGTGQEAAKSGRAKFTPAKRRAVGEVRRIGACIRCRILRKACGIGTPCASCLKVLSPRLWTSGCIRTKLHDTLDLYTSGVYAALARHQAQDVRAGLSPSNMGTIVTASLATPTDKSPPSLSLRALDGGLQCLSAAEGGSAEETPDFQPVLLDPEGQNLYELLNEFITAVLPVLIDHEPRDFTKTTLRFAQKYSNKDDSCESDILLLRYALELYGFVEIMDRVNDWKVEVRPGAGGGEAQPAVGDIYRMVTTQISALAERRAGETCNALLSRLQRVLQDGKLKLGFQTCLACIVLLISIEKTTWLFKAWDSRSPHAGWPLARGPETYWPQATKLAGLLQVLLATRHVLPYTGCDENGMIALVEAKDRFEREYFDAISLRFYRTVSLHERERLDPQNSRSLELHLCSYVLLGDWGLGRQYEKIDGVWRCYSLDEDGNKVCAE